MKKLYGCLVTLVFFVCIGFLIPETWCAVDFLQKQQAPSLQHIFGTDWYGRDIFFRTWKGLSTSILLGTIASVSCSLIALVVGVTSALAPTYIDRMLGFIIDLVMSMPHMVLQVLISFSLGGGVKGVLLSLILTHWTSMARLVRSEVLQRKEEQYIKMATQFGSSNFYIFRVHLLPSLYPHLLVGILLAFPHTILHEASLTFLGFGLSPEQAAIGVMLSESVSYLNHGYWWVLSSGLCLVAVVLFFDRLGQHAKELLQQRIY